MTQTLGNGTVLQSANNRYTIVRTLGQGSFGITYLATMQVEGPLGAIEVEVAIKEFFMKEINSREGSTVTGGGSSRDSLFDRYRQKFRHEAQNLSRMQHPGVVRVVESFEANNTSYIAMEYLGGGSLDNLIGSQGLPEEEALRYARGIGEALAYMHGQHMLHLDLKPSNVMLNRQGDPVIIDFGLSKQYDDDGNPESSTTVGGGTPGYAPIEQSSYRDGKGFPVTIDVYALGATLFKMLCGHRPPEAPDLFTDGFPYADLKHVSQSTVDIVAKAMAPNKNDRYPSVNDFLSALGVTKVAPQKVMLSEETDLEVANVIPAPAPSDNSHPSSLPEKDVQKLEDEEKNKKRKSLFWKSPFWPLFLWSLLIVLAIYAVVINIDFGNDTAQNDTTLLDTNIADTIGTMVTVEPEEPKIPEGYVDLGLPSGTLWKESDEIRSYEYDSVCYRFGQQLPTKDQFEELMYKCQWEWTSDGYKVIGPNGNYIELPFEGWDISDINASVGNYNCYWSSSLTYPKSSISGDVEIVAWGLYIDFERISIRTFSPRNFFHVRLVYNK